MKTAVILIPHVDDDLFSCWSIMSDKSYDKVIIYRFTNDKRQTERAKIYDMLKLDPYSEWVNPNLEVRNATGDNPLYPDGELNKVDKKELTSLIDKIVTSERIDELYFPAVSHHQDHEALNHAAKASLRTRRSLKVVSSYEYIYMYHELWHAAVAYKPMTKEQVEHRTELINLMNTYDTIIDNDSLVSTIVIENDSTRNGRLINHYAAERFIPYVTVI